MCDGNIISCTTFLLFFFASIIIISTNCIVHMELNGHFSSFILAGRVHEIFSNRLGRLAKVRSRRATPAIVACILPVGLPEYSKAGTLYLALRSCSP